MLAAVRLGCNLDYDKLQDLAENHRSLRQIMGIGDWQDTEVDFDWRRIEDNLIKLRPETLKKINDLIVRAGHVLEPQAIESVRGDTFVVETNIHYPTESSLIGDGLRKVVTLAARLAAAQGLPGWRQHEHLLQKVRKLVRDIGRASRAKNQAGQARLRPVTRNCCRWRVSCWSVHDSWWRWPSRPGNLSVLDLAGGGGAKELLPYVDLTAKVCDNARRRVLEGETVANEEKLFSIFEPHTELIKRGKQPDADSVWTQRAGGRGRGGICGRLSRGRQRRVGSGPGGAGHEEVARTVWRQDQECLVRPRLSHAGESGGIG